MTTLEKTCTICSEEFTTTIPRQVYCSYDCYVVAVKQRNADWYAKARAVGAPLEKICPTCHTQFETRKMRVKYCSGNCYEEARLELCRAYAKKIRDDYKLANPKDFKRECDLCGKMYDYRTKQGKYCPACKQLGYRLAKGLGPVGIPSAYKDLPVGEPLIGSPVNLVKCFVCGGPAEDAQTPCKECNT